MDFEPQTGAAQQDGDTGITGTGELLLDDKDSARRLTGKCDLRLLPPLFLLWFFPFIDRINVGSARIQGLEKDLDMTGYQFNVALVVFFIPLILVEAPSNLGMKAFSPAIWLGCSATLLGKTPAVARWDYMN